MSADRLVFFLHALWWGLFLLGVALRRVDRRSNPGAPVAQSDSAAPLSRTAVGLHSLLIVLLYPALFAATGGGVALSGPEGARRLAGAAVLVAGAFFVGWTVRSFRSYRLRARLEPGHRLTTTGPFRVVRHPIYLAFCLLGLGTALWQPSAPLIAVAAGLALVGDWRARSEERLLIETFGDAYRDYMQRTARLLPGLY